MKLENLFAEALGVVAPWKIDTISFNSSEKRLDIQVSFERGSTFAYEDPQTGLRTFHKAYDTVLKTWRHLNFFEHTCYLHVKTPRIQPDQGGTKLILPPWSGVVAGFTLLFEAYALQLCHHMPIHRASDNGLQALAHDRRVRLEGFGSDGSWKDSTHRCR